MNANRHDDNRTTARLPPPVTSKPALEAKLFAVRSAAAAMLRDAARIEAMLASM